MSLSPFNDEEPEFSSLINQAPIEKIPIGFELVSRLNLNFAEKIPRIFEF